MWCFLLLFVLFVFVDLFDSDYVAEHFQGVLDGIYLGFGFAMVYDLDCFFGYFKAVNIGKYQRLKIEGEAVDLASGEDFDRRVCGEALDSALGVGLGESCRYF